MSAGAADEDDVDDRLRPRGGVEAPRLVAQQPRQGDAGDAQPAAAGGTGARREGGPEERVSTDDSRTGGARRVF